MYLTDRHICLLGRIDEYVKRSVSAGASLERQDTRIFIALSWDISLLGPFTRQEIQSPKHRTDSLQVAKLIGFTA
ncbi:MAG: hypothetical protein AAAC48_16520 [Phyllobacterium sp.]|uniref:hypothetical protein n=1 Tax=Phyllobacterium sp. TaxID=1871046 RepID=UPI0030EFD957